MKRANMVSKCVNPAINNQLVHKEQVLEMCCCHTIFWSNLSLPAPLRLADISTTADHESVSGL